MASPLRLAAPDVPEALATITVKLALSTAVVGGAVTEVGTVVATVVGADVSPLPASTAAPLSIFVRIQMPSSTATTTTMAPRAAVLTAGRGGGRRLKSPSPHGGAGRPPGRARAPPPPPRPGGRTPGGAAPRACGR